MSTPQMLGRLAARSSQDSNNVIGNLAKEAGFQTRIGQGILRGASKGGGLGSAMKRIFMPKSVTGGLGRAAGLGIAGNYGFDAASSALRDPAELRDKLVYKPSTKAIEKRIASGNLPMRTGGGDLIAGTDSDYLKQLKGPGMVNWALRPFSSYRATREGIGPYSPTSRSTVGTSQGIDPETGLPFTEATRRTSTDKSWRMKLDEAKSRANVRRHDLEVARIQKLVDELNQSRGESQRAGMGLGEDIQSSYGDTVSAMGGDPEIAARALRSITPPTMDEAMSQVEPGMSRLSGGYATPRGPAETIPQILRDQGPEMQQKLENRVATLRGIIAAGTGVNEAQAAKEELAILESLRGIPGLDQEEQQGDQQQQQQTGQEGWGPITINRDYRPEQIQYDPYSTNRSFRGY